MNSVKNTADRRMENGVSRRREGEERKGDERGGDKRGIEVRKGDERGGDRKKRIEERKRWIRGE